MQPPSPLATPLAWNLVAPSSADGPQHGPGGAAAPDVTAILSVGVAA
jgi:hypothetical protein